MDQHNPQRQTLRMLFDAAVAAAHPERCVSAHLPAPAPGGNIIIVGAGKAAAAMAVATERHYDEQGIVARLRGSVVTRHGFALPCNGIGISTAGHPIPDVSSMRAAEQALGLAASAGANDIVVCLLSGGASALWSLPAPGTDLAAKQKLTRELLRCGATIGEINAVRKHLSRIKGGRLALAAAPARLVTLAISDVAGDDPATIGSGPTVADPTSLEDARAVLARYGITPEPKIATALLNAENESPKPGGTEFTTSDYVLVATPQSALLAAAQAARQAGYDVELLGDAIEGEAREVAARHARVAAVARARGQRLVLLSGGELTVTVRGSGRGGPNQEYCLALACELAGQPGIFALAADTDGIDGGSGAADDPAGAIVTPDTLSRARHVRNPATFLADNDATSFFAAVGDLVYTGPTQTNVNDFRAIIIEP